jgi:hypothetical protein
MNTINIKIIFEITKNGENVHPNGKNVHPK